MRVALIRVLRAVGVVLLLAAVAAPLAVVAATALAGPPTWADAALGPRLRGVFLRTLAAAAGATGLALIAALPACAALALARGRATRTILIGLTLVPLVTPPAVFGYVWMLLPSQGHALGRALSALGFDGPRAAPLRAAVAMATWLWPVAALSIAAAYRFAGRAAYRLARLDAGPVRALFHGALPAMAGPLATCLAVIFLLALNDSTIPPLVLAHTWANEIAPEVLDTALYGSPAAAVLWRSWPMLLCALAAAAAALPGARTMAHWGHDHAPFEHDPSGRAGRAAAGLAAAATAAAALMPVIVLAADAAASRELIGAAMARCASLFAVEWRASLTVATLAAAAAVPVGLCAIRVPAGGPTPRSDARRYAATAVVAAAGCAAVLPPELIAYSLVGLFNRAGPAGWLYDETPAVWLLAMLARFAFVPAAMAWTSSLGIPVELARQARCDGADESRVLAEVGLPAVWRPVAGGSVVVGCLALSEIAASTLLVPPRFGGSLAVAIDNQMHYGRNNDLVVTTLMLLAPLIVLALAAPWLWRGGGNDARPHGRP